MPRDNAAILRRRNEIAREHGFSSYGQARRWRAEVRRSLSENGINIPTTIRGDDQAQLDRQAHIAMEASHGPTGLTQDQIHDPLVEWLERHPQWLPEGYVFVGGELRDEEGNELPWRVIRGYYPRRRG